MMNIPIYKPRFCGLEKEYVNDCIDSTWISSKGKYIPKFEQEFAKYIGCQYGTAVMNGTASLHLALLTLGIGEGDEVIVPTFTYIATVNAIKYVNATPVFCDSSLDSWQLDPNDVVKKISPKTKAIIAVHLYGQPCDMQKISMLAKEHDLFLIEDCAEAIGSIYNGKKVGSFGDVSCFSFFGNKTMTTGEGGMLLTNSKDLYEKAANIKNQGVSDSKEYWHNRIGYNFRMTNIQAAIGLAQLTIVEKNLEDKAKLFSLYKNGLADLPVKMLDSVGNAKNSFWMCCLLVESEELRDSLREFLKNKGIETRPTFYTCHTMGLFDFVGSFPNAEFLSVRGINLPSFPDLTTVEIDYIINSIKEFYDLNG